MSIARPLLCAGAGTFAWNVQPRARPFFFLLRSAAVLRLRALRSAAAQRLMRALCRPIPPLAAPRARPPRRLAHELLPRILQGSVLPPRVQDLITTHAESLLPPPAALRVKLPELGARLDRVFCNRELRMNDVKVIGFDYDYTLVSYKWALQDLVYERAKNYLLQRLRYPPSLGECSFDRSFPIRGLVFVDSAIEAVLKHTGHEAQRS